MPDWVRLLDLLAFVTSLYWAIRGIFDIMSNRKRAVSFLLLVFLVFYGVPLLMDVVFGVPDYYQTPGFRVGSESSTVALIYDLFVMACPTFWWYTARRIRRREAAALRLAPGQRTRRVLWAIAVSPALMLLFAPNPRIYVHYGAILSEGLYGDTGAAGQFHGLLGNVSIVSLVASSCLLLVHRNFRRALLLVSPFMVIAVWVQGKRSIVALSMVLIWAVAWMRGMLNRRTVLLAGALSAVAFVGYIAWYQATFRPAVVGNSFDRYENSRVDYGRDHDMKAALAVETPDEDKPILDYRGESFLFYSTMFIPRSMWPDKPWPYAVYMTAHALELDDTKDIGWGLTTSFLDECVANVSWFGLLLGPAAFAGICYICDASPDPIVKVIGILIACLLMTVELVSFAPLVLVWLAYLGWSLYALRGRTASITRRRFIVGQAPQYPAS